MLLYILVSSLLERVIGDRCCRIKSDLGSDTLRSTDELIGDYFLFE